MRGTVAKRIRREVYGDYSIREKEYDQKAILFHGRFFGWTGTRRSKGLRAEYQKAKKAERRGNV